METIETHKLPVHKLTRGMMVDLEGDRYADPNSDHPEFEFEYQPVQSIEWETTTCIVIHFDNFSCGFPPNHLLPVAIVKDN